MSGRFPIVNSRKFFFLENILRASSSASGAITTSVKILQISVAVGPSSFWFNAIMPPKALF